MCKHFTQTIPAVKFAAEIAGAQWAGIEGPITTEHVDLWPKREARVIVENAAGARAVEALRWGVWPFFARDKPQFLHNARDDALLSKPTWRTAVATRRCLIPASAYYEPGLQGPRSEVRLTLRQRPNLLIAGLWDEDPDGSGTRAFTMVTTTPNGYVSRFQDRMPVVLDEQAALRWLGRQPLSPREVDALCQPCAAELMQHEEIAPPPPSAAKITKADLKRDESDFKLE